MFQIVVFGSNLCVTGETPLNGAHALKPSTRYVKQEDFDRALPVLLQQIPYMVIVFVNTKNEVTVKGYSNGVEDPDFSLNAVFQNVF